MQNANSPPVHALSDATGVFQKQVHRSHVQQMSKPHCRRIHEWRKETRASFPPSATELRSSSPRPRLTTPTPSSLLDRALTPHRRIVKTAVLFGAVARLRQRRGTPAVRLKDLSPSLRLEALLHANQGLRSGRLPPPCIRWSPLHLLYSTRVLTL